MFFATIQSIDAAILLWIQNNLRGPLDGIVSAWSQLGHAGTIWIIISLLLVLRKDTRRTGIITLIIMGLCYLFNDCLIKNLVCRPRPFLTVEGLTALTSPTSWSFPSGHACCALAAANVWWKRLQRRWVRVLLLVLAVLMALSRLYVGVHYPSDVLVGALIGTAGARLLLRLLDRQNTQ